MKDNRVSRRRVLKATAAGALSAGVAGCTDFAGGGGEELTIPDDPDGAVEGMELTHAMDEGHNTNPFDWFNDEIQEQTGVSVETIQGFPPSEVYNSLNTEFTTGDTGFDLCSFYPQYLGEFANNGHIVPLDDMMEIDGWDPAFDDLLAPYRNMYTQWGGNTYALPIDGDVLMLVYRKDLFEQHNKEVPTTWSEFNEVARYFTEETNDIDYGVGTFGARG